MFSLHDFIMRTLEGMKNSDPEFKIRQYALNWYTKGVLEDEDLMVIDSWYIPVEEEIKEEEPIVEE